MYHIGNLPTHKLTPTWRPHSVRYAKIIVVLGSPPPVPWAPQAVRNFTSSQEDWGKGPLILHLEWSPWRSFLSKVDQSLSVTSFLLWNPSHIWIFCNPMNCSLPGSSIHGILKARILEWVAISSSRDSSKPRDQTQVSCFGRQILYHWAPGKPRSH